MEKKYKLYPINRFSLLSANESDYAELFEMKEECYYHNNKNIVMKIKKNQCNRIIRHYGKNYYGIEVK